MKPRSPFVLRSALLWSTCVLFATACFLKQELDQNASRGSLKPTTGDNSGSSTSGGAGGDPGPSTTSGGAGASLDGSPGSSGGGSGSGADCDARRSQARDVLETNCAFCHELPGNQANFDFILELDKLKTGVASTGERFVVSGDPDHSRIYQRMAAG